MKKYAFLFIIVPLFMFAAIPAAAQQGKVVGTVVDTDGSPLPDVDIRIISMKSAAQRFTTKSQDDGRFTQVGVWPGMYQISFKKEGYVPVSMEIKVGITETKTLQVTMKPASEMVRDQLSEADTQFVKGNKAYQDENFDKAIEAFQEAIALNDAMWAYHFNLGLAYKKAGREDEALEAFTTAVELNPESFSCNKEMGEALAKKDKHQEAAPYYEKAVEINPEDPDTQYNYGIVLSQLGQNQEALLHFIKATELDPEYADAYYQAGTILIGQNEKEQAIEMLEKFLEIAPDHEKADIARQMLNYLK
jgi:tetratricopeptide (TPR) repeat protein